MIRVLQIVKRMDRGGLETFIINIYRSIDRSKVQFDFLVHTEDKGDYDDEITSLGGKIYHVRSRRESYFGNIADLNDFFSSHNEYSVVHMHESSMSYISPLIIAFKYKVPVRILHSRNNNITGSKLFVLLHKFNRMRANKYITDKWAISEDAARWMFGKKFFECGNVNIIKNGIEVLKFAYNVEYRNEIRHTLGISEHDILLGNVGRLSKQKNQQFLIGCLKELLYNNTNYKLIIIGNGNEFKGLKASVKQNDLENNVILLDNRADIYKYYSAFDLFLLPSIFEGLGRVLLEAQCNGLTCFASKGVIPKEVKVLPSFEFIELDLKTWVKTIESSDCRRIYQTEQLISEAGYDISSTAHYLQSKYLEWGEKAIDNSRL